MEHMSEIGVLVEVECYQLLDVLRSKTQRYQLTWLQIFQPDLLS